MGRSPGWLYCHCHVTVWRPDDDSREPGAASARSIPLVCLASPAACARSGLSMPAHARVIGEPKPYMGRGSTGLADRCNQTVTTEPTKQRTAACAA